MLIGKPRGEAALLAAGARLEEMTGLDTRVPIDPRPGTVPPVEMRPAQQGRRAPDS